MLRLTPRARLHPPPERRGIGAHSAKFLQEIPVKTSTGSLDLGFWLIAGVMAASGLVILLAMRPGMLHEAKV
jgi:hypothetical protein